MKDQRKIILESEDLIGDSNVDLFVNVELNRSYQFIKEEKFENNFDIQKRFNEERNNSRNFFLYGILDSVTDLGNNPTIDLFKEVSAPTSNNIENFSIQSVDNKNEVILSNGAQLSFVQEIETESLTYDKGNLFDVGRRKYSIFLENFSGSDQEIVYLFFKGNTEQEDRKFTIPDQIFRQPLVFRDDNGELIDYGTDTESIRDDGSSFTVFNDFPFFYNTHWVKKNIEIEKLVRTEVNFGRTNIFTIEGNKVDIQVSLDQESQFGLEEIDVQIGGNASNNDFSINTTSFSWSRGQKDKILSIDISEDDQTESTETLELSLSNPRNVILGNAFQSKITIFRQDLNKKVRYNFGPIFNNLISFGKTILPQDTTPSDEGRFSILRNGSLFENRSEAFYPSDSFVLEIFNEGENTVFPAIPGLTDEEERFLTNEKKVFEINTNFENNNNNPHQLGINVDIDQFSDKPAFIDINGVIYPNIRRPGDLIEALQEGGEEKTFSFELSSDEEQVILTSTQAGLPISVKNLQDNSGSEFSIEERNPFSFVEQIPFEIDLLANNGQFCSYSFRVSKASPIADNVDNNFASVDIPSTEFEAKENPDSKTLVTEVININRPFDQNQVDCVDPASITEEEKIGRALFRGTLILTEENNQSQIVTSKFEENPVPLLSCSTEEDNRNFMGGFQIS